MLLAALTAAGCGDEANAGGKPVVTITVGRDPTGHIDRMLKKCGEAAGGKYVIEPIVQPPTVDAQREQLIRRLAGKDDSLDIIELDVIFTAEFSEAGWIYDMTEQIKPLEGQIVPAAMETVKYKGKYWGMPTRTNVALLYYRTDLVKKPPATWEEMVKIAKEVQADHPDMAGFLFQANQYEGLTVDALEFILAANGKVLSEDGKKSLLDEGDGAVYAYTFMQNLFKEGVTPKQVTTFQEEESRQMFAAGKAVFLRNWPYVYKLAQGPDSKVKGKIDVVPLPKFEKGTHAGVLGGATFSISRFSKHPDLAWEVLQCMSSKEVQKDRMLHKGDAPTWEELYTDPDLLKDTVFLPTLRKALDNAYSRPVTPYYNDVTNSIYRTANEVAAGRADPKEAVEKADKGIQLAIQGEGEI
jgi:multiple sugar transport system substrate-binding protein